MSEENYTYLHCQHKDASELHITKKNLMGKMKIEMKNESWKLQIKKHYPFIQEKVMMLEITDFLAIIVLCQHDNIIYFREKSSCRLVKKVHFNQKIKSLKVREDFVAVVMSTKVRVYKIIDPKYASRIRLCSEITNLCGLNSKNVDVMKENKNESLMVICPDWNENESIRIWKVSEGRADVTDWAVKAHNSSVNCVSFNSDASLVATSSTKGTIIRIFDSEASKTHELRRGLLQCAVIKQLVFSQDSRFLACLSNLETVHIFRLNSQGDENFWFPTTALLDAANVLTYGVSNVFCLQRAFATISLKNEPKDGVKVHGFIEEHDSDHLGLVLSIEKRFLKVFLLDTKNGGQCDETAKFEVVPI